MHNPPTCLACRTSYQWFFSVSTAIATSIKADRIGVVRCKYGREISCRVFVGKLRGKRSLCTADENIKTDPK